MRSARLVTTLLLGLLSGCAQGVRVGEVGEGARTLLGPRSQSPCAQLAFVFYAVAWERDRGATREGQIDSIRKNVDNPFAKDPERTLATLDRVVDFVYRFPNATADEIRAAVQDDCVEGGRGQAIVRTLRPIE